MEKNKKNSLTHVVELKALFKIASLSFLAIIIIAVTMSCELMLPGLGDEIDITPPVVAITSHLDNETVSGTIVLFGTMEDDLAIENVTVSIDTELKLPVRNGNNWQIEILTDNYINGSKHICIVVTDYTSKSCEASVYLNFSN